MACSKSVSPDGLGTAALEWSSNQGASKGTLLWVNSQSRTVPWTVESALADGALRLVLVTTVTQVSICPGRGMLSFKNESAFLQPGL